MTCSICIATYKRQKLLKLLLKSIIKQNLPQNVNLQVIIVDNDKDCSAEYVVKNLINTTRIKFEYYNQSVKNISITRNVAVKHSIGDYLLFIDDDEVADQNWINSHLKAIKQFNADGVFGLVIPRFDESTPVWIKNAGFFDRNCPATGREAVYMGTGNCIIKKNIISDENMLFNVDFGVTGGEDMELFIRLKHKGAKFISSREAIIYEFIPLERTKLTWLFKKSFQTGNTSTRRIIIYSKNKFIKKTILLFKAISFEFLSIVFLFVSLFISKKLIYKWIIKTASNLGHIAAIFSYHFKGYK